MSAATPALISCSGPCSVNSVINGEISPTSPILKDVLVSLKDGLISFSRVCVHVCVCTPHSGSLPPSPLRKKAAVLSEQDHQAKEQLLFRNYDTVELCWCSVAAPRSEKGSFVPAWNPLVQNFTFFACDVFMEPQFGQLISLTLKSHVIDCIRKRISSLLLPPLKYDRGGKLSCTGNSFLQGEPLLHFHSRLSFIAQTYLFIY